MIRNTAELLDSESWGAVLETFAQCVDAAVALVDHDGGLIGRVYNPKPIWSLARATRPDWGAGCPFCLDPPGYCTAAADAEQTRALVVVVGMGGLAHTAIPLFLDGQHLGTLLAGQVFYQYPELLLLEQLAREYGLSGQELWQLARQRIPVSNSTLRTYGNLLGTLGQAYLQERHAAILQRQLGESNEQLSISNRELKKANLELGFTVAELNQSMGEKDILLNEVHHRVNNNLAVIGSLLRMQAEASGDDQVANALRSSESRVESMALIHAHLYNSADWRAVDFAAYALVLAENLFLAYGVDQSRIQLRVEIGDLQLGVDKAIPAGLILNELISNALKHAFPEGSGSLLVAGRLQDGQVELSVHDSGRGTAGNSGQTLAGQSEEPGGKPDLRYKTLGMTIVKTLCRQLKGTLESPQKLSEPGCGSTYRLSFPRDTVSSSSCRTMPS